MRCPICQKKSLKEKSSKLGKNKVDYSYYYCTSCKEEILDKKQLKILSENYSKKLDSINTKFAKWGNSIGIRIPQEITKDLKIVPGTKASITKDKKTIKISLN